jgi:hypothetical protein
MANAAPLSGKSDRINLLGFTLHILLHNAGIGGKVANTELGDSLKQ